MTNTETPAPATMHWHAGWNMPGYMPECDVYTFESFEGARGYMVESLGWHADNQETWVDEHDCDDIPCPTYGDGCPWNIAQNTRMLADELEGLPADGSKGSVWNGYAGNLVYWVELCIEDCELDTEDM